MSKLRQFRLVYTFAILFSATIPQTASAEYNNVGFDPTIDYRSLTAKDIDQLFQQDSDRGVSEAERTLKRLKNMKTEVSSRKEKRNSAKLARSLNRRMDRPEIIDYSGERQAKGKARRR